MLPRLVSGRLRFVVFKRGAKGGILYDAHAGCFHRWTARTEMVVDPTGAGDAFVGGFAAGFVKFSGDLIAAARQGNAVAALSVTKFGTAPSMPTQREIARFLRARRSA